jgi:8-oxo-dGTP pyrophosphatase MutT (NUDIX family)
MRVSIQTICRQYLDAFPQEQEALQPLLEQLEHHGDDDITARTTFDTGHVTAGAIIITQSGKRVLLIDHVTLKMRIQPGGHIEPEDDSPLLAAYRECEEETGIMADRLRYLPLSDQDKEVPFNIMVQNVPEHPVRHEPAHHHYDFWYLFTVSDDTVAASSDPGVTNHQWVPLVDFAENPESTRAAEKAEKLLTTA